MKNLNHLNSTPDLPLPSFEASLHNESYVERELYRGEVEASNEYHYPKYEINGRQVVFRNRNEAVKFEGEAVKSLDHNEVPPIEKINIDLEVEESEHTNAFKNFEFQDSDNPSATLLATNTPEGVLAVVSEVSMDEDARKKAITLSEQLKDGPPYDNQIEVEALLDDIYSACQYDESGELANYFEHSGFALVAAARSGNKVAQESLNAKRMAYYNDIEAREKQYLDIDNAENTRRLNERYPDYEAFDPSEVALVHSTQFEIERNKDGDIVLSPASAKRPDKFPRSTVHFTPNSQIISHAYGEWGGDKRLIVANFAEVLSANGAPISMNEVDTYYAVNPGEQIALPSAMVVEPIFEGSNIISKDGNIISYLEKESYSDEESFQIRQMAAQYGITEYDGSLSEQLRETALRKAQQELGISEFATVGQGAHGFDDKSHDVSIKYAKLANELGVSQRTHFGSPENNTESIYGNSISGDYVSDAGNAGYLSLKKGKHLTLPQGADPAAYRTLIAGGYVPARGPQKRSQEDLVLNMPGADGFF